VKRIGEIDGKNVRHSGRTTISGSAHVGNSSRLPRHINAFECDASARPARFDAVADHADNEDIWLRGYALSIEEVVVDL
jgi:hypothetical protein